MTDDPRGSYTDEGRWLPEPERAPWTLAIYALLAERGGEVAWKTAVDVAAFEVPAERAFRQAERGRLRKKQERMDAGLPVHSGYERIRGTREVAIRTGAREVVRDSLYGLIVRKKVETFYRDGERWIRLLA